MGSSAENIKVIEATPKQEEFIEACIWGGHDFVLYGGAIRGGKSVALIFLFVLLSRLFKGSRWILIREDLTQIKINLLPTFYEICPSNFLIKKPSQYNNWTAEFRNGSQIIFFPESYDSGLKYLEDFKGLEADGFGVDEISGIAEETFNKLLERVGTWRMKDRHMARKAGEPTPPRIIAATCNPTPKWVKARVYEPWAKNELPPGYHYIPATVYDNPHVDEGWIEKLRRTMAPTDFQKFVGGSWDVDTNKEPWFRTFKIQRNITDHNYALRQDLEVILSFDFNVDPVTAVVMQLDPGRGLYVYACHQVNGGTQKMIQSGELDYLKNYAVRICGDASGFSRKSSADVVAGGELNVDYSHIERYLGVPVDESQRRTNELHVYSRSLTTALFFNYPVKIHRQNCGPLIRDIAIAKPDKNGKLYKDSGVFRMDAADAFRYGVHLLFPDVETILYYKSLLPEPGR